MSRPTIAGLTACNTELRAQVAQLIAERAALQQRVDNAVKYFKTTHRVVIQNGKRSVQHV